MGLIGQLAYDKATELEKEVKELKNRIKKLEKQVAKEPENKVQIPQPRNLYKSPNE